ncbi:MAG: hypothetical protein ACHQQQ_14005 [Bacteroidota bacterium]
MNCYRISFLILLTFALLSNNPAANGKKGKVSPARTTTSVNPQYSLMNINNITMWASSDGILEENIPAGTGGVIYPRGTATGVYVGGLMWAGKVYDGGSTIVRACGQNYITVSGTAPGRIISKGIPDDTLGPTAHIYRIRRDWRTADLRQDASELLNIAIDDVGDSDIAAVRNQYAQDWQNWPADQGAPYYERNGIPGYQPDQGDEPGLASADQVMWFVCNDLSANHARRFLNSNPIGIEEQITCWAYANRPNLNSVVFERYRLIYKGTKTSVDSSHIDSMYIGKWVNPHIGNNSDDFAGYDLNGSFGYAYNSSPVDVDFANFNLVPPVIGYNLLQGPRITSPGDKAHWNLNTIPGYKNLPQTSFTVFANYYLELDSIRPFSPIGQWYNILKGNRPRPINPPKCFSNPYTGDCSKFVLTGDPRTKRGWVDGRQDLPGDRRIVLSSGPFQMVLGDTQEVVVALMGAMGKDNLDGINVLESVNSAANDYYNLDFQVPQTIPQPPLKIVELDQNFILDWETDTAATRYLEQYNSIGYKFHTYDIYQYSDTTVSSSYQTFPPFDIRNPRSLYVSTDIINNKPLIDGQKYYYAVTAVMYNPDASLSKQFIESTPVIKTATPHKPNPGTIYPYEIGDTLQNFINLVGVNDSPVHMVYDDPTKANGDVYALLYFRIDFLDKPKWTLIDTTKKDTLLRNILVDSAPIRVISRGFSVDAGTPHYGVKGVSVTQYKNQQVDYPVFNRADPAGDIMVLSAGSSVIDTITGGSADDADIEWRFTGDSSWALLCKETQVDSRWLRVPYTVWQMTRIPTVQKPRQVWSFITDDNQDSTWTPHVLLNSAYQGKTLSTFYPVTIYADSGYVQPRYYGGTYIDSLNDTDMVHMKILLFQLSTHTRYGSYCVIWHAYLADLDGDGKPAPLGTIIRFKKYKDIYSGDEKIIHPSAVVMNDVNAAKNAIQQINVFPNPYYGLNTAERSRSNKFVTFSHLPVAATIRVFNIAGVLVKTIYKNDPSQFAQWDLANENGLPAASGIYIVHMELHDMNGVDLGEKVLKLMLVQEQQFLQ